MTDDAAKKNALADYIKALEALADADDGDTAKLMFLLFWEMYGPEVTKGAAAEGYECPVEWAEDQIVSAGVCEVLEGCGPGAHVLTEEQAKALEEERELSAVH